MLTPIFIGGPMHGEKCPYSDKRRYIYIPYRNYNDFHVIFDINDTPETYVATPIGQYERVDYASPHSGEHTVYIWVGWDR